MDNGTFLRPADGKIHSKAGYRPGVGAFDYHYGVDLSEWDWAVRSMFNGVVVSVVRKDEDDWRINVKHNGFITRYMHLRYSAVKVGDIMTEDNRFLGRVGLRRAPHVHVEIHPGSTWNGRFSADMDWINRLLLGTPVDGSSNPPKPEAPKPDPVKEQEPEKPAPAQPEKTVAGRYLTVTANESANIRMGPTVLSRKVGTAKRGHPLRRDPKRDTNHYYAVGDNWFIHKSLAKPVNLPASTELVIGSYPGRQIPVLGQSTFELNRGWQEMLARNGVRKGTRTEMWQRWLGLKVDDIAGPVTLRALQNRLKARGFNPGAVDGKRGPGTMSAEARYLNSLIKKMKSKYPQHFRFRP